MRSHGFLSYFYIVPMISSNNLIPNLCIDECTITMMSQVAIKFICHDLGDKKENNSFIK